MVTMIKLIFKPRMCRHAEVFHDDVNKIVAVLLERGYEVSTVDACLAWEAYSEDWCCGWHVLPRSDQSLYESILPYLQKDDKEVVSPED